MARSSYVVAGVLVVAVGGWLASGMIDIGRLLEYGELRGQQQAPEATEEASEPLPPLVQVVESRAAPVTRHLVVQGDVRPFRSAAARAETAGQVAELLVDSGQRVEAGQPIAKLTLEGRGSRLREAQAVLEQRQADYDAAATLLERGFTTETRVRELRTQLESARETVRQIEEELENTTVGAPFSGVVNALAVEEGEFVSVNADVATLIDNSPLRLDVRVNQQDVARIPAGGAAQVSYATGEKEAGRVCFISAAADPQTRTFRVEVRTPNADNAIPSGISAEVNIPTDEVSAHFVSPAILSLGTDGSLGVKTVSDDGEVAFHPVEVVRAQTDGVWLSGLPESARIIAIGQGFVQAGDRVRASEATGADAAEVAGPAGSEPAIGNAPSASICDREPTIEGGSRVVSSAAAMNPDAQPGAQPAAAPESEGAGEASAEDMGAPASGDEPELSGAALVARAQQALNALGFDAGPADGVMGERTREALRSYQEANDLPVTGELDDATASRIVEEAGIDAQAGAQQ